MDAQLDNASLEKGSSSLQLSIAKSPHYLQVPSLNAMHLVDTTPPTLLYRNPSVEDILESQNAKKDSQRPHRLSHTRQEIDTHPSPAKQKEKDAHSKHRYNQAVVVRFPCARSTHYSTREMHFGGETEY